MEDTVLKKIVRWTIAYPLEVIVFIVCLPMILPILLFELIEWSKPKKKYYYNLGDSTPPRQPPSNYQPRSLEEIKKSCKKIMDGR